MLALALGLVAARADATPAPIGDPQQSPDPFWQIGPKASLSIVASTALRTDDNIQLSAKPIGDAVFEFAPGIRIEGAATPRLTGSLALADTPTHYVNHPRLNTSLFFGVLRGAYALDPDQDIALATGFHESDENTIYLPGLVRRDTSTLGVERKRQFTTSTSLKVAVTALGCRFGSRRS